MAVQDDRYGALKSDASAKQRKKQKERRTFMTSSLNVALVTSNTAGLSEVVQSDALENLPNCTERSKKDRDWSDDRSILGRSCAQMDWDGLLDYMNISII